MTRPALAAPPATGLHSRGSAHRGAKVVKSANVRARTRRTGSYRPTTEERRMKPIFRIILAITSLLVVEQVAAQIVFYEYEGFRGRTFSAGGTVNNLDGTGFNDRASSAIVQGGEWQVCEDAYFRGRCLILRPGQY